MSEIINNSNGSTDKKGLKIFFVIVNVLFLLFSVTVAVISFNVFGYSSERGLGVLTGVFLLFAAFWLPVAFSGVAVIILNAILKCFGKAFMIPVCLVILYIPIIMLSAYFANADGGTISVITVFYYIALFFYAFVIIKMFIKDRREKSGTDDSEETTDA